MCFLKDGIGKSLPLGSLNIPSVRDRVGNVSALGRRLNQMTSKVQLLDFII